MFVHNDIYISPRHTRRYYLDLGLNSESDHNVWTRAIDVFRDRIYGRYLNPIDKLLSYDPNVNGFAAMALMCLLIDSFMQFRYGLPQSQPEMSRRNYVSFMSDYLGIDRRDSNKFYSDIRCGILHSAETKSGSYLTPENYPKPIEAVSLPGGKIVLKVYVRAMYHVLDKYVNNYCNNLMDADNTICRKNFITKMNAITMKLDDLNGDYELWLAICANAGKLITDYGKNFTYKVQMDRSIIIHIQNGRNLRYAEIPFSNIKEYLHYPPDSAYYITNSWYIQSILKMCPEAVQKYNHVA